VQPARAADCAHAVRITPDVSLRHARGGEKHLETQHAHTVGTREACDNSPTKRSSSVGGAAHAVGSPALDRVVGVLVAAHLRNPAGPGRQAVSHGEARRTSLPRPQDTDTHGTAASVRGRGRDLPVAERVQLREVSQVVEVRDHVEHGCLMRPGRTPQSVSVTASARHAQSASLLHTRAEIDRADLGSVRGRQGRYT